MAANIGSNITDLCRRNWSRCINGADWKAGVSNCYSRYWRLANEGSLKIIASWQTNSFEIFQASMKSDHAILILRGTT